MGIATGGVVPEGADAVVPIEYVVENEDSVEIRRGGLRQAPTCGRAAATCGRATRSSMPGRGSAPRSSARSAAAGVAEVVCARRPRAAVLATGTELRTPGEPLEPGEIYEANGLMLEAQLGVGGR